MVQTKNIVIIATYHIALAIEYAERIDLLVVEMVSFSLFKRELTVIVLQSVSQQNNTEIEPLSMICPSASSDPRLVHRAICVATVVLMCS